MPTMKNGQPSEEDEPQPEPEVTLDDDEQQLAQSFARIQSEMIAAKRGALSKQKAEQALANLKDALAGLDNDAFRQVMANSELQDVLLNVSQTSGTEPGQPIYDAKGREIGSVPFTYADFERIYPMFEWTPPRDDMISINGVTLRVFEGRPHRAPKIFYDRQMEAIRRERYARSRQSQVLQEVGAADGTSLEVGWWKQEITENTPGWHST